MQIKAIQDTTVAAGMRETPVAIQDTGFKQALTAAKAGYPDPATGTARIMTAADKKREAQAFNAATLAEFREYMSKTPEQRMRDAILKEMGLTEEQLNALPPEERDAIEAAITARIKERLEAQEQLKANELAAKMASNKNGLLQMLAG